MAAKKKTPSKTTTQVAPTKKAARGRTEKEELVVFAFRLTPAERHAIHETAGARNATRLVRAVAVAFAHEDEKAFRAALKEAREARA